jgi:asparagine synthase (glutamine-hydrolysing)
MCGIAGIFRRQRIDARDPSRVRAMTDVITHRGPDDAGYLLLDSRDGAFQIGPGGFEPRPCDVCLGNRRLSIIDLSSNGRQPIANETGDIFAVFNGEIFDYVEIREQLTALGHVFRSQTDTEVVVHAYEQWGADCVKRFNGMWAFAVWDQRRRELFCSRDRFGIKPFYYHLDDDVFVFASEVKGILPALEARPRPDYAELREFLMAGTSCRTSDTFFEGIKRLEPSHNLFVSARRVRTDRYWDYHTSSDAYDHRQPVETFRNLLNDAVRLRLRSDVPVGIALSGGIDSTSILACAAGGRKDHGLKAFTAVFPGERFDEQEHALVASRALGAELFCVEYRPEHFTEDLQRVTWFLDGPAQEGQVLLRWRLMQLASRHVKVVLEGQGADEMLAGYPWRYSKPWELDQLDRLRRLNSMRTFGARVERYRRMSSRSLRAILEYARGAVRMRRTMPERTSPYTDDFAGGRHGRPEAPRVREFDDRLTEMMYRDHSADLLPRLLKYGDALSMAASVESRLPFLDHRLVEFVFQLPAHFKFDGTVTKGVLRQAMTGDIPESIRARRDKVGFETPVARWIGACLESEIRPILLSGRSRDRGIFDMSRLDRLLTPQALGEDRNAAYSIFRWLSAELWFRLFIDGPQGTA